MTNPRKALIPLILFLGLCCLGADKCEPRKPAPEPAPTPGDPTPVCAPGASCGCWHRPPGSDWIQLPPCPTDPPATACTIPDQGAVRVEPVPAPDPVVVAAVNAAALKVAGCAEGPPSRCVVTQPMGAFLAAVVAELKAGGRCAGVQQGADEVCVVTAPGKCQGYHVYTCSATCERGVVGWGPGSARDTWVAPGPTPPTPEPPTDPKPAGKAPPPSKYVFDAGRPQIAPANPAKVFWTVTPKVCDREYCSPDVCCPYGKEGDPNRSALEREFAFPIWEGATPRDDNPFAADSARGVHVKVCLRGPDGKATAPCAEGDAP